jgi:hypothetical protein
MARKKRGLRLPQTILSSVLCRTLVFRVGDLVSGHERAAAVPPTALAVLLGPVRAKHVLRAGRPVRLATRSAKPKGLMYSAAFLTLLSLVLSAVAVGGASDQYQTIVDCAWTVGNVANATASGHDVHVALGLEHVAVSFAGVERVVAWSDSTCETTIEPNRLRRLP